MTGLSDRRVRWSEPVSFRDDPRILGIVDRVAERKGTDRSALYRAAIRFWLEEHEGLKLYGDGEDQSKAIVKPRTLTALDQEAKTEDRK